MTVRPGAEPFFTAGSDVGVLVLHGFTGNPSSMRPWAEHLAAHGFTVSMPRLPGHGTTVEEMAGTRWADWLGEVERAFTELAGQTSAVVVVGLSMGGALALRVAQLHPDRVAGLVLVNAAVKLADPRLVALPLVKWLVPFLPAVGNDVKQAGVTEDAYAKVPSHALHSMLRGIAEVREGLPGLQLPVLVIRSREDHVVPAASSEYILRNIGSRQATELVLEESYHVATIDNDAKTIFDRSVEFVEQVTAGPNGGAGA